MGAVLKGFLLVLRHFGVLVVEEVILQCGTQFWSELITGGHGKHSRHIAGGVDTVLICSQSACGVDELLGVVLDVEIGFELIFRRQREAFVTIVQAHNRCDAPASLVAVESQIDELSSVGLVNGLDVAPLVAVKVVHAHAQVAREVVVEAIGETQLSAKDVLTALYGGVNVVLVGCDRAACLRHDAGHDAAVEHGQAVLKRALATTTNHANETLNGPGVFAIGGID